MRGLAGLRWVGRCGFGGRAGGRAVAAPLASYHLPACLPFSAPSLFFLLQPCQTDPGSAGQQQGPGWWAAGAFALCRPGQSTAFLVSAGCLPAPAVGCAACAQPVTVTVQYPLSRRLESPCAIAALSAGRSGLARGLAKLASPASPRHCHPRLRERVVWPAGVWLCPALQEQVRG